MPAVDLGSRAVTLECRQPHPTRPVHRESVLEPHRLHPFRRRNRSAAAYSVTAPHFHACIPHWLRGPTAFCFGVVVASVCTSTIILLPYNPDRTFRPISPPPPVPYLPRSAARHGTAILRRRRRLPAPAAPADAAARLVRSRRYQGQPNGAQNQYYNGQQPLRSNTTAATTSSPSNPRASRASVCSQSQSGTIPSSSCSSCSSLAASSPSPSSACAATPLPTSRPTSARPTSQAARSTATPPSSS